MNDSLAATLLTPDKASLLEQVVDRLRRVAGVAAVVLGGSYACGVARPDSDLDVGLYYNPDSPIATARICSVIYLGETRICAPRYDPDGCIAELKRQVANYPPALKRKISQDSLWCAEFALASGRAS